MDRVQSLQGLASTSFVDKIVGEIRSLPEGVREPVRDSVIKQLLGEIPDLRGFLGVISSRLDLDAKAFLARIFDEDLDEIRREFRLALPVYMSGEGKLTLAKDGWLIEITLGYKSLISLFFYDTAKIDSPEYKFFGLSLNWYREVITILKNFVDSRLKIPEIIEELRIVEGW